MDTDTRYTPPPSAATSPNNDESKLQHARIDSGVGLASSAEAYGDTSAWTPGLTTPGGNQTTIHVAGGTSSVLQHQEPGDSQVSSILGSSVADLTSEKLYRLYVDHLQHEDDKSKKKDEDKSPDLVRHFVDYIRVLEDRMTRLETGNPRHVAENKTSSKLRTHTQSLSTQDNSETVFAPLSRRLTETDTKATELLRELCPEDELADCHILRVGCHNLSSSSSVSNSASTSPVASEPDPGQIEMIFISINSQAISRFLETHTGFKFDRDGVIHVTRPFKILIQNAAAIKEQHAKLRGMYGNLAEHAMPHSPDVDMRERSTLPPQELQGALEHFRILAGFMDKYMSSSIELFDDLRAGKQSRVSFENLWMLFGTNETIYSPKQRGSKTWVRSAVDDDQMANPVGDLPQAYRIAATFGGAPLMKKSETGMWDAVFEVPKTSSPAADGQGDAALQFELANSTFVDLGIKESYSSFNILCYRLDFDGHEFGTIPGTFIIKPFDGQVDINSLEVYPLHMRKAQKNGLSEDLTERGRQFISMLDFAHRRYEGLTLGQKRDEINSQVCIDLKLAYQQQPELQPRFMSLSDCGFLMHPRQIMELPKRHDDCTDHKPSWTCFSDQYISYQKKMRSSVRHAVRTLFEDMEVHELRDEKNRDRVMKMIEEKDLLCLLPCSVPAYALLLRKWVKLDLRLIKDIEPGRSWDELVLPEGHREVVQAMVQHHANSPRDSTNKPKINFRSDIVEGKGRGCIILLHGAPGVGKTSTAECVAAYTKRPLFPITCGDIGYQPEEVERKLEDLFTLANRWGCVLLLDEADVFLAKRRTDDLKRNAVVSVFLRILEYYSGILFLTTNRTGVIDDAFRSRLHLALFYPHLDEDQSKRIWKMNMDRIKRHSDLRVENGLPAIEIDRRGIIQFARKSFPFLAWNGRQIKNAFQSALALAEMEALKANKDCPKLKAKQFRLMAKASEQFEHYMVETHHGKTEDQLAHRDRVRFTPKKPWKGLLDELSSDDDSESDDGFSAKTSRRSTGKKSKSRKKSAQKDDSSSEEEDKKAGRKSGKKSRKAHDSESSDDDEAPLTRKSERKGKKLSSGTDSSE